MYATLPGFPRILMPWPLVGPSGQPQSVANCALAIGKLVCRPRRALEPLTRHSSDSRWFEARIAPVFGSLISRVALGAIFSALLSKSGFAAALPPCFGTSCAADRRSAVKQQHALSRSRRDGLFAPKAAVRGLLSTECAPTPIKCLVFAALLLDVRF